MSLDEADEFISNKGNEALTTRVTRVAELIEGFQSSYGMELLATVHWVAMYEGAKNVDDAIQKISGWSMRKRDLMKPDHIKLAWNRLAGQGWLQ